MLVWFNLERVLPKVGIVQEGGFQILQIERGVGFWLNTYYSYGIILLAFFLLGVSALQANHFFRRQYLIILLGSLLPFSFSVFTQISYKIVSELDLAPVAFSLSGVMYVYAMLRYQFMDLLPVARERLIENMSDGVLVLDDQNRIVDINPIMKNFIAVEPSILLGRDVSELPEVWSKELRQLLNGIQTHVEMNLPDNPVRYLDLRITALYNDENLLKGRLIVFRDITDRKDVEKDLRRAMDRLQTQLIEIGLLQSQLREQAIRDSLTSVFNRRYMEETLDRELARAARESYPLCLIMMDLDHFKKVNDTHGHEAGDVVLKALADTIARQSRHGDFVCRYGGEEFVLVMPNITLATARERADELHKMVSSLNIPYGDITLTTTISMGIAMYPNHGDNKADILRAADKAMYIAKNTGRNRIIVYPEPQLSVD
jgi:diguanylate cyclase (GGDEF)-like protein/PAS domain S-box-containing protein